MNIVWICIDLQIILESQRMVPLFMHSLDVARWAYGQGLARFPYPIIPCHNREFHGKPRQARAWSGLPLTGNHL